MSARTTDIELSDEQQAEQVERLLSASAGETQTTFTEAYDHCIRSAPNAKCQQWLQAEMYGQLVKAMGRARFLHTDGALVSKKTAIGALGAILAKYSEDQSGNIAAALDDLAKSIDNSFRRVLVPIAEESVNHNAYLDILEGSAILACGLAALHETGSDTTSYYDLSKADSESPAKAG